MPNLSTRTGLIGLIGSSQRAGSEEGLDHEGRTPRVSVRPHALFCFNRQIISASKRAVGTIPSLNEKIAQVSDVKRWDLVRLETRVTKCNFSVRYQCSDRKLADTIERTSNAPFLTWFITPGRTAKERSRKRCWNRRWIWRCHYSNRSPTSDSIRFSVSNAGR